MIKRHLAGLTVAALLAGGGAAAFAAAPTSSSSPEGGSTPAAASGDQRPQRPRRPGAGIEARAVHGDLIVRGEDGTFDNVTMDRGIVQAKGDHTITLKRPDGPAVTVKVDDNTKYRGVDSFDAVQVGKRAVIVSKDKTALMVGQRVPGRNKPNRSNVGSDEEQVPAT
jgi:hypothetical protein